MTVKTQSGKVITKGGKVSCGCCGFCCLYPARALWEGKYSVDDLPDSILAKDDTYGDLVLYKGVSSNDISLLGPLAAAGAFWGRSEPQYAESTVYFAEEFSETEGWAAGPSISVTPIDCLFDDTFEAEFFSDFFADTYQITGPVSGTVTREKSCLWRGNGLILRYDGSIPTPFDFPGQYGTGTFKWKVNGNNKSGFQNTPVGSYAGGFTVS